MRATRIIAAITNADRNAANADCRASEKLAPHATLRRLRSPPRSCGPRLLSGGPDVRAEDHGVCRTNEEKSLLTLLVHIRAKWLRCAGAECAGCNSHTAGGSSSNSARAARIAAGANTDDRRQARDAS